MSFFSFFNKFLLFSISKTDDFISADDILVRSCTGACSIVRQTGRFSCPLCRSGEFFNSTGWFVCPFQILFCHLRIRVFESSAENAHCWFHSSAPVCNKVRVCVNNRCDIESFSFSWLGALGSHIFSVQGFDFNGTVQTKHN